MNASNPRFQSTSRDYFYRFLSHKRAIGRHYKVEEKTLHLFDRFLIEQKVCDLQSITSDMVDRFLASRPRSTPRSYNHLLGTVRRFFDWLVSQEFLTVSPVAGKPRRQVECRIPFIIDKETAKRLLQTASELKDNPLAPMRGRTYHTMFAMLYGLGLRVGELCRLCDEDVDFDRQLLVIRRTKFNKDRLVPVGPHMADLLADYMKDRQSARQDLQKTSPLFSFVRERPGNCLACRPYP